MFRAASHRVGYFLPLRSSVRHVYGTSRIGDRDVVGHGINGSANYMDSALFPFPAVRFKENSKEIYALREKEKGDWRMLSCEEKKALYRASFCQTFAEFQHPTGSWKFCVGVALICISFCFWMSMFNHFFVNDPLPPSFSKESQMAQLRRMLELRVNPIDGLSSKWDYDNDRWK
ncbi:cytochrome c oxidase subunit 4 isoform 1, mitochondrial-like isoform X2 [Leptidea sinapis]|uniref:cytochrome c oxidase subunit 4 isoform 1, mitochondrial-like isoform X2 n=1 Tax=Leptidea sinapis TaxID=189913 RepID=UPI0021C2DDE9|nr:cytochrome c oxidase subunit 4 isoform 1, mitochondrial-like isoform X2 [Leptidea sinapis]XP_050667819.1 cytochrome c oxidase subunit 4 isoform 1, mitochondrial-like isoform X2 [Leptidea sinapis]XP_050667820.1 cytochrome c oxidase subunit 4 isoform 1, mitochondrial-like isoform X2 [Leptidea sinapis]XP_050667821.1 cytochrome c oxidase subunit 4 isoform 1, mitochondrial-like isoform X2 [Leptidea sinapis]XP_050667822.1 cytochrome c oxidase subunit 4 isoform 1, mitochondrial-like isoform X2 [Lep